VTGLEPVRLMSTRPSNVPVYQFQHTRISSHFILLTSSYYIIVYLEGDVNKKEK